MWPWLAIGAALGSAGGRILLGYPAAPGFRSLARREVAFLDAAAEAMYPPGGPLPPSGRDARCASFLDGYLELVPRRMKLLMRMLFFLMEHATLVFAAPPPPGRRRFSSRETEQRAAVLADWRASRWFARRLVFTSLRAVLTNAYLADSEVLRHLGLTPWTIVSPVAEADLLYPPIGRPKHAIRHPPITAPSAGVPL